MKFTRLFIRFYLSFLFGTLVLMSASATTAPAQVTPYFDCVEPVYSNGEIAYMKAYFGYTNSSDNNIVIQQGPNNFLLPPSAQNKPTMTFLPGRHDRSFFATIYPPNNITWFVNNFAVAADVSWAGYCSSGTITYQGKLSSGGAAASGNFDLQFTFYDSLTGGTVMGIIDKLAVPVAGGLFTVELDVQKIFDKTIAARFFEITVRRTGEITPRATLTPRQELTFAPFALKAKTAYDVRLPSMNNAVQPSTSQCDEANEVGRMMLYASEKLYVCTAAGWKYTTLIAP